eukprot:832165-Amorphochlora_amoeboformis.AAC.1
MLATSRKEKTVDTTTPQSQPHLNANLLTSNRESASCRAVTPAGFQRFIRTSSGTLKAMTRSSLRAIFPLSLRSPSGGVICWQRRTSPRLEPS